MIKERGQITIFIIIAILIIAIVSLFFIFKDEIIKKEIISPEVAPVQEFVQKCLDDSLEKVVFRVGENGGYYFPPKISTPVLEVPYYIKNNKNLMPSKEKIQDDEISKYVARELVLCVGDFVLFPEYNITKGKITAKTIIEPERVLVDVNYPLIIKKGESISKIEDFDSEVPVRLGIVYDAVLEFENQELETKIDGACINCLLNVMTKKDLYASVFVYDNRTSIFIISDFNSKINEKEFVYIFANEKY